MISIIIPTRNRNRYLNQCLAALHREKDALGEFEIIVVDDGSATEESRRNRLCCEQFQALYLPLERGRGMAVARNTGLRSTRGDWVVFIDDDVIVAAGWGGVCARVLGEAATDIVGIEGRVTGLGNGLWDREVEVATGGACLTCHICYRRAVLLEVGGFDDRFEFEGPFHEDQELAARVLCNGRIVFCPDLTAFHQPRALPLYAYVTGAARRIEQVLRADFYFWKKNPHGYRRFRHAKSFKGTFGAVLLKYTWTALRRRKTTLLLRHPLQALTLVVSCLIAQVRAWMLLPYFISRIASSRRQQEEIWFAAAIPEHSQGGVRRLMEGLARGIEGHGYRSVIVCREYARGGYLLFSFMLALRLLRQFANPPRCIIARSTDAFFPLLLRRVVPLPVTIMLQNHGWEEYVYQVQHRLPPALVNNPVTWKAHLVRFPLLRATLRMTDCCLCGTVADMRWITDRYRRQRHKLRYVPNGVTVAEPLPRVSDRNRGAALLTVGTLTWRKNYDYTFALFTRIAAALPDARLFCVGTGTVPSDGIDKRITMVPSVPMEEMHDWYRRCPFFIHASRYEGGHSLALLEAMAQGAVCFVAPEPSNLEVVTHRRNGIVLDGCDREKDARMIVEVMNDYRLQVELSANARRTALRNRWERQAARLVRVLVSVGMSG